MTPLTPLAVSNADVLRQLAGPDVPATKAALAAACGRDHSNLNKALARLEEAGLLAPVEGRLFPDLTEAGRDALAAIARAEGPTPAAPEGGDLVVLHHGDLQPHPLNPRKDFDSDEAREGLDGLRVSIVTRGLDQNLVARREADANGVRWLIAGERRWRAIGEAIAHGDLPEDFPIRVLLKDVTDEQHALDALAENMLRRDLSPIEEGRAFKALVDLGSKTAELAEQVGRSQKHVQDRIALVEKLSPADQARMSLPKADPDYLSYTEARALMQEHREPAPGDNVAEAVAAVAAATETRLPAAEVAEITAAQALILYEVEARIRAHPELKAPLGQPTTQAKNYSGAGRLPDVQALIGEGFLSLNERDQPNTVTLLRPGQHWLASQAGQFMDADYKLQRARRDAGLDDIAIAALEADERFATEWLNVPPPPKPMEITPAEALALIEIRDAATDAYQGAEVAHDLDPATTADLVERGLIYQPGKNYTGRHFVRTTWEGDKAATAAHPGYEKADKRAKILARLRAEILGEDAAAALGDRYATDWLNGPFELSPEAQAELAEREAEEKRAEETKLERERALAQLDATIDAFVTQAASLDRDQLAARYGELLQLIGGPAPWRPATGNVYDAYAVSAQGTAIKIHSSPRSRRLAIIGVNIAAGIPAAEWGPPPPQPLDREAFEAALARAVLAGEQDDEEAPADPVLAAKAARDWLTSYLEDMGLEFGDPTEDAVPEGGRAWTVEHANALVGEYDVSTYDLRGDAPIEDEAEAEAEAVDLELAGEDA